MVSQKANCLSFKLQGSYDSTTGQDWEVKWNDYISRWRPNPEDENYIPAASLNKHVEWLRTREELAKDPYPQNVFTGCFLPSTLHDAMDGNKPQEWRYAPGMFDDATNIDRCDVIKRETAEDSHALDSEKDSYAPPHVTYTVIFPRYEEPHLGPLTVSGIPRTATRSRTGDTVTLVN